MLDNAEKSEKPKGDARSDLKDLKRKVHLVAGAERDTPEAEAWEIQKEVMKPAWVRIKEALTGKHSTFGAFEIKDEHQYHQEDSGADYLDLLQDGRLVGVIVINKKTGQFYPGYKEFTGSYSSVTDIQDGIRQLAEKWKEMKELTTKTFGDFIIQQTAAKPGDRPNILYFDVLRNEKPVGRILVEKAGGDMKVVSMDETNKQPVRDATEGRKYIAENFKFMFAELNKDLHVTPVTGDPQNLQAGQALEVKLEPVPTEETYAMTYAPGENDKFDYKSNFEITSLDNAVGIKIIPTKAPAGTYKLWLRYHENKNPHNSTDWKQFEFRVVPPAPPGPESAPAKEAPTRALDALEPIIAASAPAPAPSPDAGPEILEPIPIEYLPDKTTVTIHCHKKGHYLNYIMPNPRRLFIDIKKALAIEPDTISDNPHISKMEAKQFTSEKEKQGKKVRVLTTARYIFTLKPDVQYDIKVQDNDLIITFFKVEAP